MMRNRFADHRRRGFTVFELGMAVMLLAVAMSVAVQVLGAVAQQRRAVQRRELAVQEVANLMERLTARPWERLADDAGQARLSDAAERSLPGAELKVAVEPADAPIVGKRVSIRLHWKNRAGEFDAPVRLTTWVYPQDERRTAE
jgi:Tfp pilus assembly protein PilV